MSFPQFGTMGEVVSALRNRVDNSITELEIFWGVDEATETLDNVLAFNKLIADYPLKSLTIGYRRPIEATSGSPLYWLINGVIRYVSKSNTLECLDLRFVEMGPDRLISLNYALQGNASLKTILLSDQDKSIVNKPEATQFENIKKRLSDSKKQQKLNTDLPTFPNVFSRAVVGELRRESSETNGFFNGLMSVLKACVNPFIEHPILTTLCILFVAAAALVVCIPGIGQFVGAAGVTAVATHGIAAGLSTAFTYLAATKIGMFIGLVVHSVPMLVIAAKVIPAAACVVLARVFPVVGKGIVSLIGKGFELAKSLRSTDSPVAQVNHLQLEDAPAPAATTPPPVLQGTAGILARLTEGSNLNGDNGATGTVVGSTDLDKPLSRPAYPAPHNVDRPLLTGEFSAVLARAATPPAPTPYIHGVPNVPITPVHLGQEDGEPDPAAGVGLELNNA